MKKSKSLSIEEINQLNAQISENWTSEEDVEINKTTGYKNRALAMKGRKPPPKTEEGKRRLALVHKGRKNSEETKEKISRARRKIAIVIDGVSYASCKIAAKAFGVSISAIYNRFKDGKPLTGEILAKIRNGQRGPTPDEVKKKISLSQEDRLRSAKPRKIPEETRKKMALARTNKGGKAVSIQGVIYPTASEAARQMGLLQVVVSRRVRSEKEMWKDWFFIDEK